MSPRLFVIALFATAVAASDVPDVDRAQAFVDRGDAHFDKREFDQAIAEYTAALAIRSHPDLIWNIARANEEAGHPAEAIALFQRYLGVARTAADRAAASERIAQLEARVSKPAAPVPGRLVVRTVPGAWVTVGGARIGQGPEVLVVVRPGRYRVRVESPGHVPAETMVGVASSGEALVLLPLEPLPAAEPAQPTEPAAPVSFAGDFVARARPGAAVGPLEGARLAITADGRGVLAVERARPLEAWRRGHCGGAAELRFVWRFSVLASDTSLRLGEPALTTCSCAAFCPSPEPLELASKPLAAFAGWSTADLVFARSATGAPLGALPGGGAEGTVDSGARVGLAGRWSVVRWDAHPEARELELQDDGSGSLTVERAGSVPSWQRRRCGGQESWRQAARHPVRAELEGGRLRLRVDPGEEVACSCPEACTRPGPLRELVVEEIGVTGQRLGRRDELLLRLP